MKVVSTAIVVGLLGIVAAIVLAQSISWWLDAATLDQCIEKGHTPEKCVCLVKPCKGSYEVGGR